MATFEDLATGLPAVHLVEHVTGGRTILRFCHDGTGRLTTATDTRLRKVGLWAIELRGLSHYQRANKAGDFSPGQPVRLMRQPSNEFDPNAIAVAAEGSRAVVGFFNRQAAKRFAPVLDAGGADLRAVSIEGDPPGEAGRVIVLIAEPRLVEHVFGPRPATAAKPAHWA
ncbi:HIRAN domain-containing protein [Flexivirga sp. B27]